MVTGDGRVVFTSAGLWEASFTYSGDKEDEPEKEGGEWFLLGVKFLFKVNDARGCTSLPLLSLLLMLTL
jgi:hypothetical protein